MPYTNEGIQTLPKSNYTPEIDSILQKASNYDSLAWKASNPLAILDTGISWRGVIGRENQLEKFVDAIYGIRAARLNAKSILTKTPNNTLESFVNYWHAGTGKANPNYSKFVATESGISAKSILAFDSELFKRVLYNMSRFESGGTPISYSEFETLYEKGKEL